MQRIVVLNPKGGSGKTTLATNLAAFFAARGDNTLLIDPQSRDLAISPDGTRVIYKGGTGRERTQLFLYELDELDPKLSSRMASGLVACIAPPEHETRLAILRERAARGGVRVPEACLEVLATRELASVRDLVGGLNQVVARASLLKTAITAPPTRCPST